MKAKKIKKTLSLNKRTVTNLKLDEMKKIYGGATWYCSKDYHMCG